MNFVLRPGKNRVLPVPQRVHVHCTYIDLYVYVYALLNIKTNSVEFEGRDDSDVKHIHWRPYVVNEQTEWVLFHISYSVINVSIYVFMVIINIYICNE